MLQRFYRSAGLGAAALLALGLTACGQSEAPDCGALKVSDPWVREAPKGMDVMGAYFTLVNDGDAKVVVNGVSSSQFDRAELHETVVNDDGQASMQPMEKVTVGSGQRVAFKPGGRHVMLFKPSQPYASGDQVELILSCGSQNAELPVAAVVRAAQPEGGGAGATSEAHGDMNHGADTSDHETGAMSGGDEPGTADDSATAE